METAKFSSHFILLSLGGAPQTIWREGQNTVFSEAWILPLILKLGDHLRDTKLNLDIQDAYDFVICQGTKTK